MKKIVSVIGNGESRIGFDITQMKEFGEVVGCNAVARDYELDHYIAVDRRVCQEVANLTQNKNIPVYTRSDWHASFSFFPNVKMVPELPYQGSNRWDKPFHWGSGPYAVLVAAETEDDQVILLGFDLYGTNGKVNNVYKGTNNYSAVNKQAVDHSYWVHQIAQVFRYYTNKKFLVLNERDWIMPREWNLDNVQFKTFEEYFVDNKYLCN